MCHYALSDANVNQEVLHFVASASIELDELSLFEEAVNVLYLSSAETRVALAGKLSTAQDGDGIRWYVSDVYIQLASTMLMAAQAEGLDTAQRLDHRSSHGTQPHRAVLALERSRKVHADLPSRSR